MNKLKLLPIIAVILACVLAPNAHATTHSPPNTAVLPMQQQDDQARPAQLGENRGEIPEGGSEIWTYEGQAGDILTIKAEADKPANEANTEERLQAGLLDMMLIIYAPDGTIIAKADDIQPGTVTDSVIEGLQLPADGTYQIEALGLEKELSGAYTLTLQAVNTTQVEATPTPNPDWPTLTIENQLQDTICYAYIWPTSAEQVEDEWLGIKDVILSADSHQWRVAPDEYNIAVTDCYGNTLDVRREFDVTNSSTLMVSPSATDDPVALCATGLQLFSEGKAIEALPQLEASFTAREHATFANPEYEGICALVLGKLRDDFGNRSGALVAYQAALDIFQASGNRKLEGTTANNIGLVYDYQGKYEQALEQFTQALEIRREVGDRAGEGTTANNIGLVYDNQGKYEQALEQFTQALEIRREVGNRAGEGTTANNIGAVYSNQGKYKEALLELQQALEIRDEVGDLAGQSETLGNIGVVYSNQGKYKEALRKHKQALEIKHEVGDLAGQGTTLGNIGVVYHAQGKYEEALRKYQQHFEIGREVGDLAGQGNALNNIGAVYSDQGKYKEALRKHKQALEIRREVGDLAGQGTTTNNIGTVYSNQGKYEQALLQFQQALEIFREVGDRAGQGNALNNIGVVYGKLGKYDESLIELKQALEISREMGDLAGQGNALNNIGVVYDHQGKYEQALLQFQQALEIRREVGDRVGQGVTLNNIGSVYDYQGKYEQALAYYEQAFEIIREVGDPAGESTTLSNIGLVYDHQGKYSEALEQYKQALEIRREVGNRAGEGTTLGNIGAVYYAQGKYSDALLQYEQALNIFRDVDERALEGATLDNIGIFNEQRGQVEGALLHYEQAMDVFETIRAIAGDDQERASFTDQYIRLYHRTIGLYHQQGQNEAAFLTSERGRARSFLDSLATGKVQLSDEELQALINQERAAYDERFAIQVQLARVRAQNPPDEELVAELEAQLEVAEEAYSKAQEAIDARGDELAALIPGRSGVPTLTEVQAELDEQTTLLSYWVLGDEDSTLAFMITADKLTVIELPDATPENLRAALEHVYPFIKKDNAHPLPLRDLHSWLVAPLAEHLKTTKVGIIAHQQLHQVPFAALTDGEGYFGQQHTLFRLPSASALSHIQKNAANLAPATRPALVFGNPTTELKPLTHAGKEAASVAELLDTSVYTETEAHEARLWSEAIGAPVVHLAAHGSYNEGNALYSAIHLAPQGDYDGRLETREVYGLDLSAAEMVVLSACQTNVGETSRGDDIVGLTRAFFFAKTPTLVSSLWKVDDAATEALMSAFYRNWQDGMGKAQALQAAQAEVRANPKWAGPFFWAGFVVNGDPGEVREPPRNPWMMIVGTVGLLAIVVLMISRWRKKEIPS